MELFLNIIGLKLRILDYPYNSLEERLLPFYHKTSDEDSDVIYNVKVLDNSFDFDIPGDCILKNNNREIYCSGNQYTMVFDFSKLKKNVKCYTIFKYGSNRVDIILPNSFFDITANQQLFMSLLVFDFIILPFNRIIMHASVVEHNSEAILFTGPSGIGKSTQANLWKKFMSAGILNGDRAALDISDNIIKVYGSPYAGSSKIYKNEFAPVKAIILLEQSKSNSLKRLTENEAYKLLFSRFSLIRWNDELMTYSMDLMSKIISDIPVYKLSCYPGKDAVDLVYKTIYCDENGKNGNFM